MAVNDITGDKLVSKPQSTNYADNYDNIFRKNKDEQVVQESAVQRSGPEQGTLPGHSDNTSTK